MIYVPEHFVPGFRAVSGLDEETRAALLDVFAQADVQAQIETLNQRICQAVSGLSESTANDISSALLGLLGLSEVMDNNQQLARDVVATLAREYEWVNDALSLESFLQALLDNSSGLRLRGKAKRLAREKEKLLVDARLIMDVRPVFDLGDRIVEPNNYVTTYTLRFDYIDNTAPEHGTRSIFFGVDDEDLTKLESVIRRAREKAAAVNDKLGKQGWGKLEE